MEGLPKTTEEQKKPAIENGETGEFAKAEAMKKLVDIYKTEGLKYKSIPYADLPHYLDRGILGSSLKHASLVSRKPLHHEISKIRDIQGQVEIERNIDTEFRSLPFEKETNVYYPEGMFKLLQDELLVTSEVETYLKTEFKVSPGGSIPMESREWLFMYARHILEEVLKADPHLSHLGHQLITNEGEEIKNQDYTVSTKEYSETQLREYFQDSGLRESIRKAWLKYFWDFKEKMTGAGYPRLKSLVTTNYRFGFGFILAPDVKVAISFHSDYPTEAVVMQPRVKPNQIIGILVDKRESIDFKQSEEGDFENNSSISLKGNWKYSSWNGHGYTDTYKVDQWTYINKVKLQMPDKPLKFLIGSHYSDVLKGNQYSNAFVDFLKEKNIYTQEIDDFFRRREEKIKNRSKIAILEEDKKIEAFLDKYAYDFLKANLPIGKTLWESCVEYAEKYKLPILDTDGNVLWPEAIPHNKVGELIDKQKTPTE